MNLILLEAGMQRFPKNSSEKPHTNRIDSIPECLRAFSVDGGSTPDAKLLRSTLRSLLILGPMENERSPVIEIYAPTYTKYLCAARRGALTDESLVREISFARHWHRRWCSNGVRTSTEADPMAFITNTMNKVSHSASTTGVVYLTRFGRSLR